MSIISVSGGGKLGRRWGKAVRKIEGPRPSSPLFPRPKVYAFEEFPEGSLVMMVDDSHVVAHRRIL